MQLRAEDIRLDVIALAIDIQDYTIAAHEAFLLREYERMVDLHIKAYNAAVKQQSLLKQAAKPTKETTRRNETTNNLRASATISTAQAGSA
jgi:hypothetical protein